jgi:hypothetical protein
MRNFGFVARITRRDFNESALIVVENPELLGDRQAAPLAIVW